MPDHETVREFAASVQKYMPEFDELKGVPPSRVALLAKTDDTWVPKLKKDSEFWARDPTAST